MTEVKANITNKIRLANKHPSVSINKQEKYVCGIVERDVFFLFHSVIFSAIDIAQSTSSNNGSVQLCPAMLAPMHPAIIF